MKCPSAVAFLKNDFYLKRCQKFKEYFFIYIKVNEIYFVAFIIGASSPMILFI